MQITSIVPQYTQLNTIISEIADRRSIEFEQQRFITDFYSRFREIQPFETMLIELMMQTDRDRSETLLQSLSTEINNNIRLISSNKQLFESIDIKSACKEYASQFDSQIGDQLYRTQEISKELNKVNGALDSIGFRKHTDLEEKRLWERHEILTRDYNAEKQPLTALFDKKKEAKKTSTKYVENKFSLLLALSQKLSGILKKYLPQNEVAVQNDAYFDMTLVSAIHKECNGEQFENISEFDLYAVLNLLPTTGRFTIKKGERNRIYYLIHKLYERLPKENNQAWRTAILQSLQLDERIYQSKYRIAKGKDTTTELKLFADNLDELFKEFDK